MTRVDAHHHLWHPAAHPQPWLDRPALAALRRPFTVRDLRLATLATRIDRTVVVQSVPSARETIQLLALVGPLVAGVVGWVDLTRPVARQLAPGLVGVRPGATSPEWLRRGDVRAGLSDLARAGLAFDLLVGAGDLAEVVDTVRAVPELTFVLDHLGGPPTGSGEWPSWAADLRLLAAEPNVVGKLSGLVTSADWAKWTVADLRPSVSVALEAFGPDRLMFGSDWPVCLLAAGYPRVHEAADLLTAHLTAGERAAVFGGTAIRTYRLPLPARPGGEDLRDDRTG